MFIEAFFARIRKYKVFAFSMPLGCLFILHIVANLIPDSVFKPMSKNQNDDNDYLRLFSIVFFAVESDSGVKWSLKLVQGPKKEDLEA